MVQLKKTPLHAWHVGAKAKMSEFGGWDMPIQYAGILSEHAQVRQAAGVFDTCHMGEFIVAGASAAGELSKALALDVASLAVGRCRYGFLLNEQGGVLDDLIAYRLADDEVMLVVNAGTRDRDFAVLQERLGGGTRIEDISDATGKIDLQGPQAKAILEDFFGADAGKMPYFSFRRMVWSGMPITVSRTGYTGELGYEIYCPAEKTLEIWEKLLSDDGRVKPAGLGARDTLRLEAGLPLYGHELDEKHTPVESGFAAMMPAGDFVGKTRLNVVRERMVPMTIENRRAARAGDGIFLESGEKAGVVVSGSFSPSLGYSILTGWVNADIAGNKRFTIKTGRADLPAEAATLPFYKKGTARLKLT